jgi:hypothetical protein
MTRTLTCLSSGQASKHRRHKKIGKERWKKEGKGNGEEKLQFTRLMIL